MELAVWRGTKIDCSPSDGGLKWAGSWLVCTGIVLILASCLRCRVTASRRLKRGPPTELKRPSFHQRNDADKLNNRGYYPDSKDLQQPKHSQIYIIHALVYHSHRNISCLDYSSVNAVRQIHLPTPATYKRRLRQRRRAVHDKESSRSEFEMGSGEIADSNHLPRELTPGGNDTVEAGDIGGDRGANMEVTVPENHPVLNDSTETSERLVNSDIDPTTEKGSTAMLSSTIETTTKATTVPVVIVSDKAPKPPYVIVTHSERSDVTTTHNMTVSTDVDMKTSNTGAIVGVIVSLLVIGLIIAILVILMKKKRIKMPKKVSVKRKKLMTKMENPQYKGPGKDYRFSRDSALHIGNTANLTKFNNPNLGETPIPRVLQQESPSTARRSSLPKSIANLRKKERKAPPPPNPFGDEEDELYEKASRGSGDVEMQTFAVRNENASEPADTRNEQSYPLLKRSESSREKNKARDKNDNTNGSAEPQQDPEIQADPSESLLPKEKSASQDQVSADVTLDTYDLTKNPFFAKE